MAQALPAVRPAAVAGSFYPADPAVLARDVDAFLATSRPLVAGVPAHPKALIVPHAGHVYSGAIAALGFALIDPALVRRVVLLGPTHRIGIRGLALPGAEAFATPLGRVAVVAPDVPGLDVHPATHAQEHALEVQLPFLQRVYAGAAGRVAPGSAASTGLADPAGEVAIVPIAVGTASSEEVAAVIEALWGGPETLILVSSDLSHYLGHDAALARDAGTISAVLGLRDGVTHDQACGATPVNGLLVAARRRGLRPTLLGSCTSGDTAGDRARVVGYAAVAFHQTAGPSDGAAPNDGTGG